MGARPLQKVDQIITGYYGAFSISSIASALDISESRARAIFTNQARVRLAGRTNKSDDVYGRARIILQTVSELERGGIPARIATYLARNYSSEEAKVKAGVVMGELVNKPSNTSDLMWMWIVAVTPTGTHQQRLDRLRTEYNWFAITSDTIIADPQEDWRFDEYAKNISLVPAPASTDPSPTLRELGEKAGVSEEDLKQLLLFFGDFESCEMDGDTVNELVTKIQNAHKG
jgi:hypothetical protein